MNPSHVLDARAARPHTQRTATFPSVALPTHGLPIEVNLVARLGHGAGSKLFHEVQARQAQHGQFVDALDEPSARLGSTDFERGDATALYSFSVGPGGHPFHRHAGHRVFTAVSGSAGAQLRFSTATPDELAQDPGSFVRALRHINVPPDCLFTVRFSGEHWHQFVPLVTGSRHPAFFALSTHTNELGGDLSDELRQRVLANAGDIPSLTELLPDAVRALLLRVPVQSHQVPTTVLSLDEAPGGLLAAGCRAYRSVAGHAAVWLARGRSLRAGYVSEQPAARVHLLPALAADSLLHGQLRDRPVHHQDCFGMSVPASALPSGDAAAVLAQLLDSFLAHRHAGVSRLMACRNLLVRPLKLRRSPLACPVSSLLGDGSPARFGRHPVHAVQLSADGRTAQVVLGADDKHLAFRSSVEVRLDAHGMVHVSLANRVACRNAFGRVYMALIERAHRRYIAPRLLAVAVDGMMAMAKT